MSSLAVRTSNERPAETGREARGEVLDIHPAMYSLRTVRDESPLYVSGGEVRNSLRITVEVSATFASDQRAIAFEESVRELLEQL